MSLERERAIVEYDPGALTPARMVEAIRRSVVLPRLRRAMERAAGPRSGRRTR